MHETDVEISGMGNLSSCNTLDGYVIFSICSRLGQIYSRLFILHIRVVLIYQHANNTTMTS